MWFLIQRQQREVETKSFIDLVDSAVKIFVLIVSAFVFAGVVLYGANLR